MQVKHVDALYAVEIRPVKSGVDDVRMQVRLWLYAEFTQDQYRHISWATDVMRDWKQLDIEY